MKDVNGSGENGRGEEVKEIHTSECQDGGRVKERRDVKRKIRRESIGDEGRGVRERMKTEKGMRENV